MMNQNELRKLQKDYAELLIREGLNIQKGQRLAITCQVECAEFVRLCVDAAYEAGCREVLLRWRDDAVTRARYLHADGDVFDAVNPWEVEFCDVLSEEGAGWLAIHADNPENLKGVDPDRIRRAQISTGKALKAFRERQMRNEMPWCVCSVPTKAWAQAVFPDLDPDEAVRRLWEEILAACRVDGKDAVRNWKAHSAELQRRVEYLNACDFRMLRYQNSAGTDVTVELPDGHFWAGGEEKASSGVFFSANIPTEEVFTLPKRDGVNGVIVATKPLSLHGTLIEGFSFVVKDGRITEVHAEKGEAVLRDAVSVDEGASYFGEVALVPYDSPISQSGVLFYNTLFDENASCHFAFGEAYPCIKDADKLSQEELAARGVNYSMMHVDFMVGSRDLSIVGVTKSGEEVPVFVNGNFAF